MNKLILCLVYLVPFISDVGLLADNLKNKKLKIELGHGFANDAVKIYLDKKLVYNKAVSSKAESGVTDVFFVVKPKKPFSITVEVNGQWFEKSSLKNEKELDKEDYSILINYNRDSEEVEIKTKAVIVLYD
jgi:hypothetical protein